MSSWKRSSLSLHPSNRCHDYTKSRNSENVHVVNVLHRQGDLKLVEVMVSREIVSDASARGAHLVG